MSLADIVSDVTLAEKRAKKMHGLGTLDAKFEMVNNVYPLLRKLASMAASQADVAQLQEELDDLLEDEGSIVQPELAQKIYAFTLLAQALVAAVRETKLDDMARKKLGVICADVERMGTVLVAEVEAVEVALEDDDDEGQGDDPAEAVEADASEDEAEGEGEDDAASNDEAQVDDKPAGA